MDRLHKVAEPDNHSTGARKAGRGRNPSGHQTAQSTWAGHIELFIYSLNKDDILHRLHNNLLFSRLASTN